MRDRLSIRPGRPWATTLGAAALAFLVAGCVDTPTKPAEEEPTALFYPPLPNPPRIQYLASFNDAGDLKAPLGGFGSFILGDETTDPRGVEKPYGVAVHAGKVFVADTRGNGYAVFDVAGKGFKQVTGSGGGAMKKPINIALDEAGNRYVTDTDKDQVLVFDASDRFVRAYGVEGQFKPGDVVIAEGRLYVSDLDHHNIHVLDRESGRELFTFGKVGSKDGELYFPTNMALGPDRLLYVSDTGNFRIQKFTLDGEFVASFGQVGTGIGQFARPKGIAVDRKGRIYVVDAAFENVQILDPEGRVLLFFGEPGSNHPAGLDLPTDIAIDYDSAPVFQRYADPKFKVEYVIVVASQFGRDKIDVFGFGRMAGMDYPEDS